VFSFKVSQKGQVDGLEAIIEMSCGDKGLVQTARLPFGEQALGSPDFVASNNVDAPDGVRP
jgi:hypothetical protein